MNASFFLHFFISNKHVKHRAKLLRRLPSFPLVTDVLVLRINHTFVLFCLTIASGGCSCAGSLSG
jgi:hypothetical protein